MNNELLGNRDGRCAGGRKRREGGNAITIQQSIKIQTRPARLLEGYD